jgi:hypothetical protein
MKARDKGESYGDVEVAFARTADVLDEQYFLYCGVRLLNDQHWDRIKRASGLPAQARSDIETDIGFYLCRQKRAPAEPPAKLKEKLRKLRSQARELLEGFEEALDHNQIYFALVPVGPEEWYIEQREKLAEHHRTEKVRAELRALINWLDQGERGLSRRKPGPPAEEAQNVHGLVDSIDNTLRIHAKKRLTRSLHHRKMMEEIFAIVDPKVGKGTIDTAMRQVIAFSREWKG